MDRLPRPFAPYEILEELGRGTPGTVYKVRDTHLGRLAALKTISPTSVEDWSTQYKRFLREARVAASVSSHPNIAQLYQVGESDGRPFLVREFVDGAPLADHVERGTLSAGDSVKLVEAIARAIHHVHERGILHRNVSLENILVAKDGTPKLIGFGRVRTIESGPETVATDIHALGGILNACRTSPASRLKYPPELLAIEIKYLHTDPAFQYRSAAELADDLRRLDCFDDQGMS